MENKRIYFRAQHRGYDIHIKADSVAIIKGGVFKKALASKDTALGPTGIESAKQWINNKTKLSIHENY